MILQFATKRNINGYRKFLAIDTDIMVYSTISRCWYCEDNTIEIKARDRKKLITHCEQNGFKLVDYCN